jgi:phosphoribosyl-AMP cyclohydrolase
VAGRPHLLDLDQQGIAVAVQADAAHELDVKRDADGLVAAIIQQHDTREVLMLGWMDEEAVHRTLTTGRVTFWSRSRRELWRKGDTSGPSASRFRRAATAGSSSGEDGRAEGLGCSDITGHYRPALGRLGRAARLSARSDPLSGPRGPRRAAPPS